MVNVLIVDDSLTVRMDLKEVFESSGFTCSLSETLCEARELIAQENVQVVVLDLLLPDGQGIDLLKEIKSHPETENIVVVLLSSEAEVKDRIRGLSTGADEYVGKPYDRSYVVARVKELVGQKIFMPTEDTSGATILVIDDSLTYRTKLQETLEKEGYVVVTAVTGEEGLRTAAMIRPAAMVIDGQLPGIDGATVVRRVRSDVLLRSTPCVLLTASEDIQQELQALESGADTFIRKEESTSVLLARLSAILRTAEKTHSHSLQKGLLGPQRILAVDDSPTYLHEIAEPLREDGYEVIVASSGEEALRLLEVQPADCILLDLVMPGLSGLETCRRIKATPRWREIPLLLLTAREDAETMLEGFQAGADDYICKSSEFEVVRARVRAQLRRKQFEDENRVFREELVNKGIEAAEARANRELAETRAKLLAELEISHKELEISHRELESFSYSVSHDLRAPLRAINGFAKILSEEHTQNLNDEGKHLLQVICERSSEMGQLIDDLLTFSRLGKKPIEKSVVDLDLLVKNLIQTLTMESPERQVEFVVKPLGRVLGDKSMLRQVFFNLLSNALKFTFPIPKPTITIGVSDRSGEKVFYVKDNGVGFDMKLYPKMFGVFQRLHDSSEFEGTGVGLATVNRVVQKHGGRIWAEGKVNQGAQFYFTLESAASDERSLPNHQSSSL